MHFVMGENHNHQKSLQSSRAVWECRDKPRPPSCNNVGVLWLGMFLHILSVVASKHKIT